jgi:hypothetical protein
VPLQLREEHLHVQRVAEVVQEARRELEDADVQLEVSAVAVHDQQRRQERQVAEHLKAKDEADFPQRLCLGGHAIMVVDVAGRTEHHRERAV